MSLETDLIRAYHAVRYMAEMQQSVFFVNGKSGISVSPMALSLLLDCNSCVPDKVSSSKGGSLINVSAKVIANIHHALSLLPQQQQAYKKIPLPFRHEIAYCLDLLEAKSEQLWRDLIEIRRCQIVIEDCLGLSTLRITEDDGKCKERNRGLSISSAQGIIAQEGAVPTVSPPLLVRLRSRSYSVVQPVEETIRHSRSDKTSLSPFCKAIMEQNKKRIEESHLYSSVIAASVSNAELVKSNASETCIGNIAVCGDLYYKKLGGGGGGGVHTKANSRMRKLFKSAGIHSEEDRQVECEMDSNIKYTIPAEPENWLTFKQTKQDIAKLRPTMIKEIAKRKLSTKVAWEQLSNRYLNISNKWNHFVSQIIEKSGGKLQSKDSKNDLQATSGNSNTRLRGSQDNIPGMKSSLTNYMSLSYTGKCNLDYLFFLSNIVNI